MGADNSLEVVGVVVEKLGGRTVVCEDAGQVEGSTVAVGNALAAVDNNWTLHGTTSPHFSRDSRFNHKVP
jgi:hypothetical protein